MGLTVHYSFELGDGDYALARERVEQLRQRALELPFENVGDTQHLVGGECVKTRDRLRWFGLLNTDGGEFPMATPDEIIGFTAYPKEGCESAEFGLRRRADAGYGWQSFCKTAYAKGSHLDFLRCHLSVIAVLDYAQELGLLRWVDDDSDYWQRRDWMDLLLRYRKFELKPSQLRLVSSELLRWFGPLKEKAAFVMQYQ